MFNSDDQLIGIRPVTSLHKAKSLLLPNRFQCYSNISLKEINSKNEDVNELLHSHEIDRYNTFKSEKRKCDYLAGRVAAKIAVTELKNQKVNFNEICIEYGGLHFPVIMKPFSEYDVSISHSENIAVAIAYGRRWIAGIDIEYTNENRHKYLERVFTEREKNEIRNANIEESIIKFVFWTAKEALGKALKIGLNCDFKFFEIDKLTICDEYLKVKFKNFSQFEARSVIYKGYVLTVVISEEAH